MSVKILVIEDDSDTADIVRVYLEGEGYLVLHAWNGLEGIRLAQAVKPHLVILDLMLPTLNGMDVCRQIRQHSKVPIIMLTARVEEADRLDGLNSGADDYVTKPFSPRELIARVRAVLRRVEPTLVEGEDEHLTAGDIVVDLRTHKVWVARRLVHLTPTEMRILTLFLRDPGRVFTRQQILDRVFSDESEGFFDRVVDSHISNLRRKLGSDELGHPNISTVYGVGYRLSDD